MARTVPDHVHDRAHLDADDDRLISGSRVERIGALAPNGGRADLEWIVRAETGTALTITIRTAEWGEIQKTVTLEERP